MDRPRRTGRPDHSGGRAVRARHPRRLGRALGLAFAAAGPRGTGHVDHDPRDVTVTVDGKTLRNQTTAAAVAEVLSELHVSVGAKDRVSPAMGTPVTAPGLDVVVARVTQKSVTATQSVGFGTTRKDDGTRTRAPPRR